MFHLILSFVEKKKIGCTLYARLHALAPNVTTALNLHENISIYENISVYNRKKSLDILFSMRYFLQGFFLVFFVSKYKSLYKRDADINIQNGIQQDRWHRIKPILMNIEERFKIFLTRTYSK